MPTPKQAAARAAPAAITPEGLMAGWSPEVRGLAQVLRSLILNVAPAATEIAYPVWKGIGYHHGATGYFCAIFPAEDGVKLGFEFGVLLPDPEGLLVGTGKQVRYVHIADAAQIPVDAIKRLIVAALSLPEGREARLSMVRAGARQLPTSHL